MDAETLKNFLITYPGTVDWFRPGAAANTDQNIILDTRLARIALEAGWEEDAIVDLLQEANTHRGQTATPQGYCRVTINEARVSLQTGRPPLPQQTLLHTVEDYWGLSIAEVIRHGKENALWSLRLRDAREITLGETKKFLDSKAVRAAIFDVTGQLIPRYGTNQQHLWDEHVHIMAQAATVIDTPEFTNEGHARSLMQGYLRMCSIDISNPCDDEQWQLRFLETEPYIRGKQLYISADNMYRLIRGSDPSLEKRRLYEIFRYLKGKRKPVSLRHGATTDTRQLWVFDPFQLQEEIAPDDIHESVHVEGLPTALPHVNGQTSKASKKGRTF